MKTIHISEEQHTQLRIKAIHSQTTIAEALKRVLTKALGEPTNLELPKQSA